MAADRIPEGFQQTEVGVIPVDWEVKNIGSLTEKIGSGITPTGGSRVYKSEGSVFLRSQNVGWGSLLLDEVAFIDEETHKSFDSTEIKEGDVLLNITGASIGRCAIADQRVENGNVNQHVCIIRGSAGKLNPKYLSSIILSSIGQNQIDSFQAGGNRQGLNFGQIKAIQIPLPPTLAEQAAIAAALSDMDVLIESLERLIGKKRAVKQGAMQELLRPKENWTTKQLGDVLVKIVGGGTPSRSNEDYWNGKIPWVTVKDFSNFDPFNTQEYITEEGLANSASNLIPSGVLIISTRMAVGKAVIYNVDVCINQDLKALFPNEALEVNYLYYWFQQNAKKVSDLASGSTVMGISLNDLKSIEISFPEKSTQIFIARTLSDMDAEIGRLEAQLAKYRRVKEGMMQELLTGKKRLV
ncbi:MAG: restriction endonuclease subunit S [Phaeodactylibacter sp.]|nr:restriction endonuclease subunit S [Phaeodactylibacter sp.]